jgi:hypothetical protein
MNAQQEAPTVSLQNELYSNAVDVNVFLNDFIFKFGRFVGGKEVVANLGNVVMSPQSAKRFLASLQNAVDAYEAKYGEISTGSKNLAAE